MNPEDLVISLNLAKRLEALGVGQESFYYWRRVTFNADSGEWQFVPRMYAEVNGEIPENTYSAFTAAELLEIIPYKIDNEICLSIVKGTDHYEVNYGFNHMIGSKNIANALALMLIHLIENNFINTHQHV